MTVGIDRFVPPLLRSVEGLDGVDDAAFWDHAATLTHQLAVTASVIMLAATLLWWPVDRWVFDDPRAVAGFSALRWRASGVELLALVAFALTRPRRVATPVAAVLAYGGLLAAMTYSLGGIGPAALPWLADAFIGLIPAALIPMATRFRLPAVAFLGACLAVPYFAPYADNAASDGAPAQLSFLAFAVLFTAAVGEVMTRVTRRAWFEQLKVARANAQLAELTDTLSDRVAERTARLHALTRHIDALQEAERRRIAHDLHDDLGQQLTAMRYTLARLEGRMAGAPASDVALVGDLDALLAGASEAIRGVVARLRPRVLDDLGLVPALEWLCDDVEKRAGVPVSFRLGGALASDDARLDSDVELVVFRAVQEATTNALKHGAPRSIDVQLSANAETVTAVVSDDGVGFDVGCASPGFGLFGIRERLRERGGELRIDTAPGDGARVTATLPTRSAQGPT